MAAAQMLLLGGPFGDIGESRGPRFEIAPRSGKRGSHFARHAGALSSGMRMAAPYLADPVEASA
ncbi:MAG: hypothetical protein DMG21_09495 [Acidobacteria bacterium]|nr:MAG: hypothetical protein DMG21_09495 [Acidobacteriota bacterium]